MTRAEFESRLPSDAKRPSEQEFKIITLVYDYHPAMQTLKAKDQIAMLYSLFGMTLIYDMRERAARILELNKEIRDLEKKLTQDKEELQALFE